MGPPYVLAWKLSNTMDTSFCVAALEEALGKGRPEIFNTDQGSQFTSEAFTQTLQEQRVQVSMDGKGRYLDNIFVERLWRSRASAQAPSHDEDSPVCWRDTTRVQENEQGDKLQIGRFHS